MAVASFASAQEPADNSAGGSAQIEEKMVITAPKSATVEINADSIKPKVYDSDIQDMLPDQKPRASDEAPTADDAQPARPESTDQPVEVTRWGKKWIRKQEHWGVDGLRFTGKFGLLRMKLGGRLAVDVGTLAQQSSLDQAYPDFDDTLGKLRSAQLQVVGNFGPYLFFKLEYEAAAAGSAGIKDAYIVLQDVPVVSNIRFGMGKEPISLESLTSSKFNAFMERSLDTALIPGRSIGAMAYDDALNQRLTWATGIFYRSASWGDLEFDSAGGTDIALRVTGLPIYITDGKLLHLGMSLVRRNYASDLQFSSLPESRLTETRYVDTGSFDADDASIINLEAAWNLGSFSMQGEYTLSLVEANGDNPRYQGSYIQASYYLTGEKRPYNKTAATFGHVVPLRPFSWGEAGSRGAWEVAARFSTIDLDSGSSPGGQQQDITLGLNWYPGYRMRVMFNYINGNVDSLAEGRFSILQARFLYAF